MKKPNFPHPLALLFLCIFFVAGLTWILPAGEYDRVVDEATGSEVVVAGSYAEVESSPVGFFDLFVAIPKGIIDAADVIALVFLIGGAFVVIEETEALNIGVRGLTRRLKGKESLIIIIVSFLFAFGGALNNLQEEVIALIPVILILTRKMGFNATVAVAMSIGSAAIGSSFSPVNPFQVIIAQKLAQIPLFSGAWFRIITLILAFSLWQFWLIRYAFKTQTAKEELGDENSKEDPTRANIILSLVMLTFVVMIYGVTKWGWDFNEMSAIFVIMGLICGFVGKLGLNGTASAYARGFREMAFAALIIGFARAIYVVLDEGAIIDTLVYGLFKPVESLPSQFSAVFMMVSHVILHIPVPSVSGQAVLTMPVLIPLSDLLGISRQVTILAYQFGAGLTDMITPTNGALMGVLAAAGMKYEEWFSFVIKRFLYLIIFCSLILAIAILIGLN